MRIRMLGIFILLIAASTMLPVHSAVATKSVATVEMKIATIPVYPKGSVAMEINLSDKDILPAINQLLTGVMDITLTPEDKANDCVSSGNQVAAAAGSGPSGLSKAQLKEFKNAISGLKQVSAIYYSIPSSVKPAQVSDFYVMKLGLTKAWMPTFRVENLYDVAKAAMPYVAPGVDANAVKPETFDMVVRLYTRPGLDGIFGFMAGRGQVMAFRTEGKIDLALIMKIGTQMIPNMTKPTAPAETIPPQTGENMPEPAEATPVQ